MITDKLIAGAIIVATFSFTIYMGINALIRSSWSLDDLSYVSGEVTNRGMVKHAVAHKRKPATIEDVLFISIEGSNERFGFLRHTDAFQQLLGFHTGGKHFKIYYDPDGDRIQGDITLHVYDLTVGQAKIIDIKQANRKERLDAIFYFTLSFFLLAMVFVVAKKVGKKHDNGLSSFV